MRGTTRPPIDPRWLTGPRMAAAVAALGGGAMAAWLFRGIAACVADGTMGGPWLELVLFCGTALLTARAVVLALESADGSVWVARCSQYGALNGIVCELAFFPIAFPDETARNPVALLCVAPFAAIAGCILGWFFFAGYFPVLALARRARTEPSLDLVTRMIPWCAAWLTSIGVVLAFVGPRQTALVLACVIASVFLLAYGIYADRARRAFLVRLDEGRTPHRFTAESEAAVLPFIAGVGADPRTLLSESTTDHGPFRSAAIHEAHASFSRDPMRERRALRTRVIVCAGLLAADLATAAALLDV